VYEAILSMLGVESVGFTPKARLEGIAIRAYHVVGGVCIGCLHGEGCRSTE
jgi:hypothetical protein